MRDAKFKNSIPFDKNQTILKIIKLKYSTHLMISLPNRKN